MSGRMQQLTLPPYAVTRTKELQRVFFGACDRMWHKRNFFFGLNLMACRCGVPPPPFASLLRVPGGIFLRNGGGGGGRGAGGIKEEEETWKAVGGRQKGCGKKQQHNPRTIIDHRGGRRRNFAPRLQKAPFATLPVGIYKRESSFSQFPFPLFKLEISFPRPLP